MALLGVLAAVVLVATKGATTVPTLPTTSTTATGGHHSTTTTSVGIPTAALRAACTADYATVSTAAQEYAVENGGPPPPGRAWATSHARGGPFLQSWPSSPAYALTWSGAHLTVQPWHHRAASVGSAGTSSPPTGCDAI